ncbi:MAG: HTH domain-containing protein [Eubacteriales bacterium]
MTVQDHLRDLLESNKSVYLSGEEIARRLGVSRNAVWKAIKALQSGGYHIAAAPDRGYCLAANSDVLSDSGIRRYLTGEAQALDLIVYDAVDSTNLVLRALAGEGAPEGTVVIAAEQTGGRGRKDAASTPRRARASTSPSCSNRRSRPMTRR